MLTRPSHHHSAIAQEVGFSTPREDDCVGENPGSNRRREPSRTAGEADTKYVSQRREKKDQAATYTQGEGVEEYPAQFTINLIQGKWKTQILSRLQHGPVRLSELRKMVPHASKKMLTQHLREMEEDGLVIRTDLSGKRRHVEYTLSRPRGLAIAQLINVLAEWGKEYW